MTATRYRLLAACGLAALAIIGFALYQRGSKDSGIGDATVPLPSNAQVAANRGMPTTPTDAAPAQPPTTKVKRFASPAERRDRIEAIAAAHRAKRVAPTNEESKAPVEVAVAEQERNAIRNAFRELVPFLQECYEAAVADKQLDPASLRVIDLTANLAFFGALEVGTVADEERSAISSKQPLPPSLAECFRETLLSVEFPPIDAGDRISVTYPFRFSTEE